MNWVRNRKKLLSFSYWYFLNYKKLNKEKISENVLSQLQYVLLRMLNKKWTAVPVPLTSVYPPLSQKNQRNCDCKNNMCIDPTNLFKKMFYCLFQSSTVSSSCHRSNDDEKAIRGIKKKPMYLAKQFIQLRTNRYSLETGLSEKKGGFPVILPTKQISLLIDHFLLTPCEMRRWP